MNKDILFKIKLYGIYVLIGIIASLLIYSTVITQIDLFRLKNEYKETFLVVSKNFDKVSITNLNSISEIEDVLDNIDLTNETKTQKIQNLKSITIQLEDKIHGRHSYSSTSDLYYIIGAQENIELLMEMEQKYKKTKVDFFETDKEKIVNAFLNVKIYRDKIKK